MFHVQMQKVMEIFFWAQFLCKSWKNFMTHFSAILIKTKVDFYVLFIGMNDIEMLENDWPLECVKSWPPSNLDRASIYGNMGNPLLSILSFLPQKVLFSYSFLSLSPSLVLNLTPCFPHPLSLSLLFASYYDFFTLWK